MAHVCLVYLDINTELLNNFNHGIAYLAGALKKAGHDVDLLHIISQEDLGKVSEYGGCDVLGFSLFTNQLRYIQEILGSKRPDAKIIAVGGIHATLYGEELFDDIPNIDCVCVGEGEESIVELCNRLDAGDEYHTTPGFIFKNKDEMIRNEMFALSKIEDLCLPDYSVFDVERILDNYSGWFSMIVSRGCPYSCTYCCNTVLREIHKDLGNYVRLAPFEYAIDIIKNNLRHYPEAKGIIFLDDTFTMDKRWVINFCKRFKADVALPFIILTRVERVDKEILLALKSAGCKVITYGVETGNEWLRKNVLNRDISDEDIKRAFKMTQEAGIDAWATNMTGLPFETKEMGRQTLELNRWIRADNGVCFIFYPYPKTELGALCRKMDLVLDDIESISGVKERPSIKEIYNTHKEMISVYESLYALFYCRLFISKFRIPKFLERPLLSSFQLIKSPIRKYFVSSTHNKAANRVKAALGKSIFGQM